MDNEQKTNERTDTMLGIIMVLGFSCIVAGIAAIYWPAALIAGGMMLLAFALPRARRKNKRGEK